MKYLFFSVLLFLTASPVLAQHGGKAEPKRIHFAKDKSSITLTGTLSRDEEMDYIFAAVKGQKVTIKNSNHNLFDFRIFSDEFNVETEFDSSPSYTLDIPETGDYLFFVRKKAGGPRLARYLMTMTIR